MYARIAQSRVAGRALALAVVACLMVGMSIPAVALAQPMPGSIKTTDATCAVVNANQYATRPDVYLDVDGVPDGDYYVRVEGPTGTTLGVTPTASLHVIGGEIVVSGAVVGCVQIWSLTQFAETDSPGGAYKVLISMDPAFPSNESKSDNFKVDSAAMTIDKGVSLDPAGPFTASLTTTVGTTVHYRIVVANTGNVPLTGITLVDTDSTLAGCTIPTTLAVGAFFTCEYSATATVGTNPNTATVDSTDTPATDDTATVTVDPAPAMTVEKGVSLSAAGPFVPSLTTTVGTTVHYRITIANTGNVPLTGITLVDDHMNLGVVCTIPTDLAVGASYSCDYSQVATLGTTTNTATADSAQTTPIDDTASATATPVPTPAMTIDKGVSLDPAGPFTASLTTTVGTTVHYRIVVANTGNVPLTGITLVDTDSTLAGCTIPTTLAVGAFFTCEYSATATVGTNPNTATVDSTDTPATDDTATVTVDPAPAMTVEKGVSLSAAGPFVPSLTTTVGTTVHYRITIANTGNVPLTGITLVDDHMNLGVVCTIPTDLAVGASYSCDYSQVATLGTTTNTATADSAQTTPIDDTASATATPVPTPAMTIDKGVSLDPAGPFTASLTTTVGTTVHYRIVVANTGNVPLTGITLVDTDSTLAGCTIPTTLAVGAFFTCEYSATATVGTNPNTATVDSTDTPATDDTATVTVDPAPAMTVEKGVSLSAAGPFVPSLTTTVGTTVHYRITIVNTGNVPLPTFSVTDSQGLPSTCTMPPSLLVGATWSCNYSLTAAAGTVINTATADSAVTTPITDTATVTATPVPTPSLAIDKGVSLDPAGPFTASLTTTEGMTVHYRITVTNTGNVPLSGVTLVDTDSTLAGCTIPTTLAVGAFFTCDYSATATLGTNPNTATADSLETPSSDDTATVIGDPGAAIAVTPPPTASPTIAPTPTGSVAAVTSPPSPTGEVGGVTARPGEVTLPPTDADTTALSGGSSGVVSVLLILVGLALMGAAAILSRPNARRRSDRTH